MMQSSALPARRVTSCLNALTITLGALVGSGFFVASEKSAMACNTEPYIGTICTFAFDFCPRDYAPADGRLLQISTYQALFALIGVRYGGNATQTFALPDLRSRSVVGTGQGTGLNPVALAGQIGQPNVTILASNLPPHTHPATFTGTGGGAQTVTVPEVVGDLAVTALLQGKQATGSATMAAGSWLGQGGGGSGAANIYADPNATGTAVNLGGLTASLTGKPGNGPITFSVNSGITGGVVAVQPNTGGGLPLATQSPGLGMTQCIAVNGLFPPRP